MIALRTKIAGALGSAGVNTPQAIAEYIGSLPIDLIPDDKLPQFFEDPDPENPRLREGALQGEWITIPQVSPRNAYPEYVEPILTEQLGFAVESLGKDYADEYLYRAENDDGVAFFMSLVKLKGSGAIMIIWTNDPRENAA